MEFLRGIKMEDLLDFFLLEKINDVGMINDGNQIIRVMGNGGLQHSIELNNVHKNEKLAEDDNR